MRVVKIAVNRTYADIIALLSGHLELLHRTYSVIRVKDHYFCPFNVLKALKRSLSGIAACCNKDNNSLIRDSFFGGNGEKIGKKLERHVLERAGRAAPEFKNILSLGNLFYGSNLFAAELSLGICSAYAVAYFLGCIICEKKRKNLFTS